MTVDSQQQRMLELLRGAGGQPVGFGDFRAEGIAFPASVASELELGGYAIERVYDRGRLVGLRLHELERGEEVPAHRRGLWRRQGR